MKYKLKFEVFNQTKEMIRDSKIDNLLSESPIEFDSDYSITIPNKGESLLLNGTRYVVAGVLHDINSDTYTSTVLLEDNFMSKLENYYNSL